MAPKISRSRKEITLYGVCCQGDALLFFPWLPGCSSKEHRSIGAHAAGDDPKEHTPPEAAPKEHTPSEAAPKEHMPPESGSKGAHAAEGGPKGAHATGGGPKGAHTAQKKRKKGSPDFKGAHCNQAFQILL